MDQIKRQLSSSQSIDVETKKLRTRSSDESKSYTYLENLSNELLYEIFEYLDAYDIHKSFSNLNFRLQNLIISSSILLRIKLELELKSQSEPELESESESEPESEPELEAESELELEYRCQHVIIPNSHRILSLHLADYSIEQLLIDTFFNHCIIDSSFHRLESIFLKGIKIKKLLTTLSYLKSLPRLFSLTIYINDKNYVDLGNIYLLIFSLPTLKYNQLYVPGVEIQINIPHVINKTFSTIEYLVIGHFCTLNQLNSLLHYTPQLRHLSCNEAIDSDKKFKKDLPMKLPHLKSICFKQFYDSFDEFEVFIKEISSQLQILNINIYWKKAYLDSNRWEQLIKKYMPELEKFYFKYIQLIYDNDMTNLIDSIDGFIKRFNSPFWIERKLFRELKIHDVKMEFSIHSYRKEWISLHGNMSNDTYSKQNSIENNYISNREKTDHHIIQLTIGNNKFNERSCRFIKKFKPALEVIQFTHLNIENDNMCLHILSDILPSLPNIESLKLSYLPIFSLESLSTEDTRNGLSISTIDKITKVKLGQVTEKDEQEIQFFINLCPHIEYFEIGCMSGTNVPSLMKFIMERRTRIPNLCYLYFIIPMADENMVRNLAEAIVFDIVIDNYTIQRSGNKISVHWKL
ncbi:unnamed protein product [Adineta steineri]|uniref:F-box domain-containing protein n=1 Tax=Adineta steineri TaxID=433720 RepID=A0A819HVM3_9BILA|nr:unnamed protein product [Adineta steineri]CAF3907149.1 unnamed protein product [Adineta steineri]